MPEESIDEIIEEILRESEEKESAEEEELVVTEEVYECPVCHHTVPPDAKFCPYCYAVFEDDVNYRDLTDTLIKKLKMLARYASERNIPLPALKKSVGEAKRRALAKDFQGSFEVLQEAYVNIMNTIIPELKKEIENYTAVIGVDSSLREIYGRAENLLEEWDINGVITHLNELKSRAEKLSKELRLFLEELDRAERAVTIAKNFSINPEKAVEAIDRAKDLADKKQYREARETLKEAFTPLREDIDATVEKLLKIAHEELMRRVTRGGKETKKVLRLVKELKIYRDEGNWLGVLEKMDAISKELSKH